MSLAIIAVVGTSVAQTSAVTPQVPYTEWTTEKEIFVPMRDGINLDTDVLLPKGAKGPLATVLVRTPYDKDNIDWAAMKHWYMLFLQHGYAFVFQNERGRHFSEGTYKHYLEGAATDGYDTSIWIPSNPGPTARSERSAAPPRVNSSGRWRTASIPHTPPCCLWHPARRSAPSQA